MTSLFSRSKRGLRTGAGLLGAALMLASHAVPAAGPPSRSTPVT